MSYKNYRVAKLKADKKRKTKYKINNSYGTQHIYRYCITNKLIPHKLPYKTFSHIIKTIHESFIEDVLNNRQVIFPNSMGGLVMYKKLQKKAYDKLPVDWDRTLRLWYEDEEAEQQKILVRYENKYLYKIQYLYDKASDHKNSSYYWFNVSRTFKKKLIDRINDNLINALIL